MIPIAITGIITLGAVVVARIIADCVMDCHEQGIDAGFDFSRSLDHRFGRIEAELQKVNARELARSVKDGRMPKSDGGLLR